MRVTKPVNIAVFASGSGSNAQKIFQHFKDSEWGRVALLISGNPQAFVLERAARLGVPAVVIDKTTRKDGDALNQILAQHQIELIVLAGYMQLIPQATVRRFPRRIVNIHPALLPAYGGKGMFGDNVHAAVLANKEQFSGITIHYVDEVYDQGEIIFQAKVEIKPDWDLAALQEAIHTTEHQYYPGEIEKICKNLIAHQA